MKYKVRLNIYKNVLALGYEICKKEKMHFTVSNTVTSNNKRLNQIQYDCKSTQLLENIDFCLDMISINNGLKCIIEETPMNELHISRLEKLYEEYIK